MLVDIEASPTPYHAAFTAAECLSEAGFVGHDPTTPFPTSAGSYYTLDGGALMAWVQPAASVDVPHPGYCIVGATDSPNLRVKPQPDYLSAGFSQLSVAVYGGALLNSWLDRDLGLAGRVGVKTRLGPAIKLFKDDRPILRVPQLAIHLDRDIRESGLKLNPQTQIDPIWSTDEESFTDYLAAQLDVPAGDILSWDVMAYDTLAPRVVGLHDEFLSSARIDNLVSSFCGVYALGAAAQRPEDLNRIPVLALYDHEEVGSLSATGADGVALIHTLERISLALGYERAGHLEGLASSVVVSADGAHATHPNYLDKHDLHHHIHLNQGIVIKQNVNQRYATDAQSDAWFRSICHENGVPVQTYVHRNDLPCGSTIGPVTAGRLGIPTVDCGAPQLAMHSIREIAGTADITSLVNALGGAFRA
ncbi:MAG: M18 family aminopeptidase [Acidimicrobiales bacterium]